MGNIKSLEVINVTPALAVKWLENTQFQRPLNQRHVNNLVSQLKAGKFRTNGETIILCDGKVLDGQHRLWMVVEANEAVEMAVAHVRDASTFTTIDTGRTRSAADVVSITVGDREMPAAVRMAASAACVICLSCVDGRYSTAYQRAVTNETVSAFIAKHPVIVKITEQIRGMFKTGHGVTISHLVALVLQVNSGFPDVMQSFVEPLATGEMLVQHSAVWAFREKCKTFPLPADFRTKPDRLAVLFKAWNAHVTGQTVKSLRYSGGTEAFPTLIRKPGQRVVNRKRA